MTRILPDAHMQARRFPSRSVIGWLCSINHPNRGREVVNHEMWVLSIVTCLLYVGLIRYIAREVRG